MYPGNYNIEWLGYKGGEPVEEAPKLGSVARAWQWRERGINPPNQPPNKTVLENIAEDILVQKPLQITSCDLPGYPRSTFLMVFSPDGTKLASTHGNHNIYVSELASGKHVRILRGHPRTPWCIAFHPSHPQLIGSGCLGGQVRVWDIASGGSEVWNVYNETVIASIAFHPREQLLVIATYNELYFWDWSQPAPFTKVSTKNINEKVRYVAFDSLGFKLITGISLWACSANSNSTPLVSATGPPSSANNNPGNNGSPSSNGGPSNTGGPGNSGGPGSNGGGNSRGDEDGPARPPDTPGAAQDMIVNSYQTLVQRYDSLVRNYQRLFMVRHRLINTPPLANTIDRGTDPMETYPPDSGRHRRRSSRRSPRSSSSTAQTDSASPTPSTSRQHDSSVNDPATTSPPPNIINLEEFAYSPVAVRSADSSVSGLQGVPVFRSIASAFQPLDERSSRLLPNPFSSTNDSSRQTNSSRTSGIFRGGPESALSALRQFSIRRRNIDAAENAARELQEARNAQNRMRNSGTTASNTRAEPNRAAANSSDPTAMNARTATNAENARTDAAALPTNTDVPMPPARTLAPNPQSAVNPPPYVPPPLPTEPPPSRPPPPPEPEGTGTSSQTASLTDPTDPDGEANTINESLDLIRDILRDSGTRLLNLITNMSMNILSNSERDESARVPVHVFTGNLRRDFMASSSDSDTEHTEVNITRTPNTTFREGQAETNGNQRTTQLPADTIRTQNISTAPQISNRMTFELEPPSVGQPNVGPSREGGTNITDRMMFEPNEARNVGPSRERGINVSMSNDRFRVRVQNNFSLTPDSLAPLSPSPVRTPSPVPNPSPSTSTASRDEPQPGPSTAPDSTDFDPNMPSTSRGDFWSRGPEIPAAEAIHRVQLGVTALQKHTLQLANMWLRGDRTTMRELRTMWEDLRRRIMALHREAGSRADAPSFYTRSLLERCMILTELTEMTDLTTIRPYGRVSRRAGRSDDNQAVRNAEANFFARCARIGQAVRNRENNQAGRNAESNQATRNGDSNQATRSRNGNQAARIVETNFSARCGRIDQGARSGENNQAGRSAASNQATRNGDSNQATRSRNGNQAARTEEANFSARCGRIDQAARSGENNQAGRSAESNQASKTGDSSQAARTGQIKLASRTGDQAARSGLSNHATTNGEGSSSNSNNPSTSSATAGPSTSAENTNDSRTSRAARAQRIQRNKRLVRLQQAYRWRADDEARRRDRNSPVYRVSHLRSRHRSNLMRTVEQNATRHVIRTRAMKVLSVMFNMMMMCLEERGLSQLIINMLKTLKKALALTCFMMMSNRNMPRTTGGVAEAAQSVVTSADVVRIQNVDHSGPVNVEDSHDPHSLRVVRYDAAPGNNQSNAKQNAASSSTQTRHIDEGLPNYVDHSWSYRVAVQISAANRNNSSTARTRRDMYLEIRRQNALHRTNPTAHPFVRRRCPPVLSHRIPAMRSLPPGRFHHRVSPRSPPPGPDAGPSTAPDQPSDPTISQPAYDRDNFIRLAHIRLRTAARNRFRRLQTIRLYTPSSVREMFALQDFQQENRAEPNRTEDEELEVAFGTPVVRNRAQFHALMAGEGVLPLPLMQVNDLPPAAEAQAGQAQRLPRIHEYLQPIILAQNAMVVDDSDGPMGPGLAAGVHGNRRLGGMAGLLDAGIISEALPAPSHRVQAWDFTTGAAPDIADNTKNVVVQRCRIHNDASIDISKDGRLLVALLPVPRLRNTNNWLGVYSLEWPRLGQCLHTAVLEQSAVSVALSPTARYLAVGLGSRRFTSSHSRTNIIALLYKLDPLESSSRTGLSPMKELEQYWEHGFTSLNCLRWAPQPGQGLVYANNTGQLIIMS